MTRHAAKRPRARGLLAISAFVVAAAASPTASAQADAEGAKPARSRAQATGPADKPDKNKDAPPPTKPARRPEGDEPETKGDARAPEGDAGAAARAPGEGGLPPGHPPVGEDLPLGHPPVGAGRGAGHGKAGGDPHGEGAGPHGRFDLFDPPPDRAEDDASLPPGVVVVTIKDAEDRPVPRSPITLGILRSTVAKGESRERLARETDEAGVFRFEGLATGSATSYRVTTTRGPATFAAPPFTLGDKAGKRVVLHTYDVASGIDDVLVGMQGIVYVSLREDAIQVENLLGVFNVGRVAWVPDDVAFALPDGFKAFTRQEGMTDVRVDEVKGTGAALRGTFGPGQHELTFRYQVPLEGGERQRLHIELPPRVAQMRVMVEASKSMGVEVAGFPGAQRTTNRDGKRILVTERQVSRAEGGIQALDVTITGLPTPGPGRWIAVGLGVALLAYAGAHVARKRDGLATDDEDARRDLLDAKSALLDEIVALERAHRRGDIGPKAYARMRAALLDALARIVERLDRSRPRGRSHASADA